MSNNTEALKLALDDASQAFASVCCKLPVDDFDAELLADALNRMSAALAQAEQTPPIAQAEQPAEPDMRHPKIQALIGGKARREIELRIAEDLLSDPGHEISGTDGDYWLPLHDKIVALQQRAEKAEPAEKAQPAPTGAAIKRAMDDSGIAWLPVSTDDEAVGFVEWAVRTFAAPPAAPQPTREFNNEGDQIGGDDPSYRGRTAHELEHFSHWIATAMPFDKRAGMAEHKAKTDAALQGWMARAASQDFAECLAASEKAAAPQPQAAQQAVAWVNPANLASAAVSRERGGPFDQHTWSEQRTDYHTTPLCLAAAAPTQAAPLVALTQAAQDVLPPAYMLAKLQMVMPLFQEARDALTAISEAQRKLHGISPTLADRMDEAGTFSLDDWKRAHGIHAQEGATQAQEVKP